jgi:hypothetical protein
MNMFGVPKYTVNIPTPVAHARAAPSVLPVLVHALEPPAQQRKILLTQHVELLIWHGHKARQRKLS